MLVFLSWLIEWWLLVVWLIGITVAYIYGGKYAALVVATLGFGAFMYNRGKTEKNKHAENVQKARENAYDEITNRGTDRNDVIDRLRKSGF